MYRATSDVRRLALLAGLAVLAAATSVAPAFAAGGGGTAFDPHCGHHCRKQNLPQVGLFDAGNSGNRDPYTQQSAVMEGVSGAGWVRIGVNWAALEPDPRAGIIPSALATYDAQVRAALSNGMQVMLTLGTSPSWARPNNPNAIISAPPEDIAAYQRYLQAIVAHFGAMGVHTYEIWNEPNLAIFWPSPDPAAYAGLLKATYPVIKGVDPTATVVAGGLAPVKSDYPPLEYLRAMYAAGAKGYFDVLSVHVFPNGDPGLCRRDGKVPSGIADLCFVENYRNIQRLNADKRPIWITEFGYGTDGLYSVTAAQQAQYLLDGFKVVRRYRYLKMVVWYTFRDLPPRPVSSSPTGLASWIDNSGLVTDNFTPKPAFAAFQKVAYKMKRLRAARGVRRPQR